MHLQLNFVRLQLEIEQHYLAGKLVKWCVSSLCIYSVSKRFFCGWKYIICEFYFCTFCSMKLSPINFVTETIRKETSKQKVNSISSQHAASGQFFPSSTEVICNSKKDTVVWKEIQCMPVFLYCRWTHPLFLQRQWRET